MYSKERHKNGLTESSEDEQHAVPETEEERREREAAKYLKVDGKTKTVELISPATGKVLRINNCSARIATSADALEDLKKIEEDVIGMTVLPDFGYAQDNYIIGKNHGVDNWKVLTDLLNNNDKYSWLLNQIKIRTLRKDTEEQETKLNYLRTKREQAKKRKQQQRDR